MSIVEQAVQAARAHGATRITEIEVEAGMLQQVVPEALQTAFEFAANDTPAQGATLHLTESPPEARCRACGHHFEPTIESFSFLCPVCKHADVEILAGNSITLLSVTCDETREPSES
jgi:hydrogenase nickel incorporation protein HypA/HybF